MKTCLEKLIQANRWRIKTGEAGSSDVDGWNGCFMVPLEGELWFVMISDQMGWKHLSVSNAQKKILPSWTVLGRLKDLFYGDDEWACQFFPAKNDYINDHPFCLHIWKPLDDELPKPSIALV